MPFRLGIFSSLHSITAQPSQPAYHFAYDALPRSNDPRPFAVDTYVKANLHSASYHEVLKTIDQDFPTAGPPDIACSAPQTKFLILQARMCNAKHVLEVQRCEREKFDFAFIEANKQDDLAYFYAALDVARERAVIAVDIFVRHGKVLSAEAMEKDNRVKGTRELVEAIEAIGKMERIEATAILTVGEKNYDGFLVAMKN
ncbi:S-adenosyl-L-methionine-dependent methyltransferase [Penicillium lividum]|nr:S-adenosyl-L-methionine-dependent methyltransferase [Penicillium lividum]